MTERPQLFFSVAVMLALVVSVLVSPWHAYVSNGPNVILILSDDQSMSTLPAYPPPMPFLQSQMQDPNGHWVNFTNGFISNPLCCPARASIFTGQYSFHNGVLKNAYGDQLKEDSTFATWMHDVGYYTGFFGKYENQYPFHRPPYVPPGWDRWAGKFHGGVETVYFNYTLIENGGQLVAYGSEPQDYMPDVLAKKAVDFIESAPGGRPFLLEYAPTGPHAPWVPALRHAGTFGNTPVNVHPNVNEVNVSDKPAWVQALPVMPVSKLQKLEDEQRAEEDALLSVDDGVRSIVEALKERGILNDTVIIFLTDNGYSYGSHRWIAKRCEYEECNRTPFLVRYPGTAARDETLPVSNVDIASTLAGLAGVQPGLPVDGINLASMFAGAPPPDRPGVLLEWPGDSSIPGYYGIRTRDFLYVELATGERELYDLKGTIGDADPWELHNVAGDQRYAGVRYQLATQLAALKAG